MRPTYRSRSGSSAMTACASQKAPHQLEAPKSQPHCCAVRFDRFDAGHLRILGGLKVSDRFEECDAFLTKDAMTERMNVITEPLEWYTKPSPWGGAIATPAAMVQLLYSQSIATLRGKLGQAVGLYGAIELRNINGPVQVEHPYRVSGSMVGWARAPRPNTYGSKPR